MLIVLQQFGGERPRLDPRRLGVSEAQAARNCKLWEGTLRPWYRPRLEQVAVNPGPLKSIYRYSDAGYWLHWNFDVDVARGPVAGSQRLYWTGDGIPKFGNTEVIAGVTTLAQAAASGQNFVLVNNALAFAAGDNITVTQNSGTHSAVIMSVQLSLNRLNLSTALTAAANAGNQVKNNNTAYPHASYPLGVPAPTNAPTATPTPNANKGTVISLAGLLGEKTGTTDTAANTYSITTDPIDGQGFLLNFQIDVKFLGLLATVQTQPVQIRVFRDPGGANEKIYEVIQDTTFQGPAADASPVVFADPNQVYWTGDQFLPLPGAAVVPPSAADRNNTAENHPNFLYTPAAGPQTYKLEIVHGFTAAAAAPTWTYDLRISVRRNQESGIVLNRADHGLREGDKVQFGGIVGTGTIADLNKGPVTVLRVDTTNPALIYVDSEATGAYTSGGTWEQVWDDADLEARAYVYTYVATVDNLDMEGPPSPPSAIIDVGDNRSVTLGALLDPLSIADGRPYRAIRVYRTATGDTTDAQFLFVMEISAPTGLTAIDTKRGTALGDQLSTTDWDPPPADLTGLTELPNGGMAGFRTSTNELCLCVPYFPHAWPVGYRHSMLDTIVGIASFGQSIAVGSKGRPTVVTGIDPASMSEEHIELVHPCLSKRGMVDTGYGVVYPTLMGLCYIAQGVTRIITTGVFTDEQWRALNPASFVAAQYGNRYLCFYDNGTERAGFILDPEDPNATLTFLDYYANDVWADPRTNKLYLVRVSPTGAEEIVEWNDDTLASPLPYRWRSREYIVAVPTPVTVVKVDAEDYPVQVNLYADGRVYASVDVPSSEPVRVSDAKGRARKWEVELVGDVDVEAVYVARNMAHLTQYLGG